MKGKRKQAASSFYKQFQKDKRAGPGSTGEIFSENDLKTPSKNKVTKSQEDESEQKVNHKTQYVEYSAPLGRSGNLQDSVTKLKKAPIQ